MSKEEDAVVKSHNATKVEYAPLGSSGLKVSRPIFGCMSFGDPAWAPWVIKEDEALPLLKAAYDRGLNTWDTANMYSNGRSEEIIAKAIEKYKIPREKLVILTKCWAYVGEEPGTSTMGHADIVPQSKDYVNAGGLSRSAIFKAVNASLKRLKMDYIDVLQIHRYDSKVPDEEVMSALNDLVRSGKVHYIGASSMWAYQFHKLQNCAEKHGYTKFISMQNRYNVIYREEEREMNKLCHETGVGLIPWAPLAAGNLARPIDKFGSTIRSSNAAKLSDVDTQIIGRVQEIAEKKGWPMSHVATAWINKYIASPIIGFSKVERIDEACDAKGKTLTDEEMKYLEELYQPKPIVGHS